MTREGDFLARWSSEKAIYFAWGKFVSEEVQKRLIPVISPIQPSYFLRTPVIPRIKDDQKLVEKAFYRKKNYEHPYDDITDKVGTRFVVLLGSDIRIVEEALVSIQGCVFSKDRDYEEEQRKNPLQFDYAAVHFVVRTAECLRFNDIEIPAGTSCEVQIKTLLQHAYSELTHDTIYKPQIEATHFMQRNAAKAVALLEATNDYFERVATDVRSALESVRTMTANLSIIYRKAVGIDPKPTVLEGLLLDAYEQTTNPGGLLAIENFLEQNPFISDQIKMHVAEHNPIFSQPSVLLVYFAVRQSIHKAIEAWPLTEVEMEPLLNDLGESVN